MPSKLSLALIGCLHIKPMIIGNYLSLNKTRKNGCVTLTQSVWVIVLVKEDVKYESNRSMS